MHDEQNRRRTPRLDMTDGRILIVEVGARYETTLIDLSTGGFLVSTAVPYPLDVQRDFLFTDRERGWRIQLEARVVYSYWHEEGFAQRPEYRTGFSFVNAEARAIASRIDQLMAHASTSAKVV